MYYPLNYDKLTWVRGHYSPASVKSMNNRAYAFWERDLYQKFASVLDFPETPESWTGTPKNFLKWCLIRFGKVAIFDYDEAGYSFQPCNLSGYDFYYQPTLALIANPVYNARLKIGEECELLQLTPDYLGLWDIIAYYAEKLATLDTSINTAIINSKFAFTGAARNKAEAEALKTLMDRINKGEPAVFYDKAIRGSGKPGDQDDPFIFQTIQKLKENYILSDLLQDRQSILNDFNNTIGIQTLPYQKAERFVASEAESKAEEARARIRTIEECAQNSIKAIKELFPDIKLSFKLNINNEGSGTDGNSESNFDRPAELG